MFSWRSFLALVLLSLLNLNVTTCNRAAETPSDSKSEAKPKTVELQGVDTSALTAREKEQWSGLVTELLAPCADQPVSLAQCVSEKRSCALCEPAVKMLLKEVRRGKTKTQAEAAFRARFAEDGVRSIDEAESPWEGAKQAPVTIIEFADFQCPACRAAAPRLHALVDKFAGQVKLVFKHYPLPSHENAEKAARAAVAAQNQGKFWEMHKKMFDKQEALDKRSLISYAKELGLDTQQFEKDLESEPVADRVAADRKLGDKLSLDSTPSIFINGRVFSFAHFDFEEDLEEWVALEIELKTGQAPQKGATRAASQKVPPQPQAADKPAPEASAKAPAPKPTPPPKK